MDILNNTDVVVALGFLVFVGILLWFRVPTRIGLMLDQRADRIRDSLDEARALREEAQKLLASFERKQKDVKAQAEGIVTAAKAEAERARERATEELERSIARRVRTAEDQIRSAEAEAVAQVRNQAADLAVAAAAEVMAERMTDATAEGLVGQSIETVRARMH